MPSDFPEVYVFLGCMGAELHYETNGRAIKRWLDQFGCERLVLLRRGYLRKLAAADGRSYTRDGRKTLKRGGDYREAQAGDPALAYMPIRRSRAAYRGEVWVPIDGRGIPDV